MKRRDFIKSSVALPTAAAIGVASTAEAKAGKSRVESYRQLGRTDIRMSDISCGTGRIRRRTTAAARSISARR